MTTYRCWIAEFAKQYSNLLVQEECPIGLFLYDTPCSLLHILLEPVVPLLVERGISARLISWPEIEELLKLSEFVDEVGDDPWERQKPEWKESFGAFKQLCEIKDSKDLLVIYDFNRISNRAADIWLGSVAHYRARLNSFDRGQETTLPRPGLSHMLWIFSPL